jgi:hypothetical protein
MKKVPHLKPSQLACQIQALAKQVLKRQHESESRTLNLARTAEGNV